MGEVRYMISEAAKQVQVESHVLRYWEEELGLEIGRTEMGHRYYTKDDIQLFLCIQKLKNEGMLLRDLKPLIPELTNTRKKISAARTQQEEAALTDKPSDAGTDQKTVSEQDKKKNTFGQARPFIDQALHPAAQAPSSAEEQNLSSPSQAAPSAPQPPSDPPASTPALTEAEVIPVTQLEQFRSLIGDVLTEVVTANNAVLKKDLSRKVTADVIREMDFLFQANERREEEHYRKLDCLIRQQQNNRKEAARETPIGKLRKLLT